MRQLSCNPQQFPLNNYPPKIKLVTSALKPIVSIKHLPLGQNL